MDVHVHMKKGTLYLATIGLSLLAGGCRDERPSDAYKSSGISDRSTQSAEGPAQTSTTNIAISGEPPKYAQVGDVYIVQTSISSMSSRLINFSARNLPHWLSFDTRSGRLSGTPTADDVGTNGGITLTVTDPSGHTSDKVFDITVLERGNGLVELAWSPPEENIDGTPLVDLAGYRISYGHQPGIYLHTIDVNSADVTSFSIAGLVPGVYFFTITAYSAIGSESELAPETMILIP
jgi:hypothetical protein